MVSLPSLMNFWSPKLTAPHAPRETSRMDHNSQDHMGCNFTKTKLLGKMPKSLMKQWPEIDAHPLCPLFITTSCAAFGGDANAAALEAAQGTLVRLHPREVLLTGHGTEHHEL